MQSLLQTFTIKITPAQSMKLFTAAKALHRSLTEHFLYLTVVSDACGGADNLFLDKIVHYADPTMRTTMLSRLNLNRGDYLRQAEELEHFAQSTKLEDRVKQLGRDVANVVDSKAYAKNSDQFNLMTMVRARVKSAETLDILRLPVRRRARTKTMRTFYYDKQ